MLFYQMGNNTKIGDNLDKKKIQVTYFFMRNQNMKFQNIRIVHGSKLMLYTIFHLIGSIFNQVISSSVLVSIPNIMVLA